MGKGDAGPPAGPHASAPTGRPSAAPARELRDGEQGRGSVNSVARVGRSVRRPTGPWTPAVHDLLLHLETVGFAGAPRVLGIDAAAGHEMLTYLEGQVAMRPWPDAMASSAGMRAVAELVRAYHAAVRDYRPRPASTWRAPDAAPWREGMIIRHGDLGPWNMVWQGVALAGLIDWDLAEPGSVIEDVAQLAWYCVPLRGVECGVQPGTRAERLAVLCEVFALSQADVLEAVIDLQNKEMKRIIELGRRGVEPWKSFAERGDVESIAADGRWLAERLSTDLETD